MLPRTTPRMAPCCVMTTSGSPDVVLVACAGAAVATTVGTGTGEAQATTRAIARTPDTTGRRSIALVGVALLDRPDLPQAQPELPELVAHEPLLAVRHDLHEDAFAPSARELGRL